MHVDLAEHVGPDLLSMLAHGPRDKSVSRGEHNIITTLHTCYKLQPANAMSGDQHASQQQLAVEHQNLWLSNTTSNPTCGMCSAEG